MRLKVVFIALSLVLLLNLLWILYRTSTPQTIVRYRIVDLGTLGGVSSYARSINENGEIVGSSLTSQGVAHAFLWKMGKGMVDLGSLSSEGSYAFDINDRGLVVGGSYFPGNKTQAFVFSATKGMVPLGDPGPEKTFAFSINNNLQVVGHFYREGVGEINFLDLSEEEPGHSIDEASYNRSNARAINDKGQIIGHTEGDQLQAFLWDVDGATTTLGSLSNDFSQAIALNNLGQVVGLTKVADARQVAFFWDQGKIVALDSIHPSDHSRAYGLNNVGQIVGAEAPDPESLRQWFAWLIHGPHDPTGTIRVDVWSAVLWEEGKAFDLNELVSGLKGWFLEEALDINDKGQIVGNGEVDGKERAFLLDPIESTPPSGK